MIEMGRYINIPVEDRICCVCDSNEVESEIHFLISCSRYSQQRQSFFQTISTIYSDFMDKDDETKFIVIMSSIDKTIVVTTAKFIIDCFRIRDSI